MAVVADAEVDSPIGAAPGGGTERATRPVAVPAHQRVAHRSMAHRPTAYQSAVHQAPVHRSAVHRSVRTRSVRLVRAGDQRRPGHVAVAPGHRQPAVCAPRPRAASFGWLILAAGLTLLIVLGAGWLGSTSDGNATVPVPSATTVVSIHSGETLWDVATQEAPGSAPQAVVDRIRQLNNLDDATLYPGEMLRVPVETR